MSADLEERLATELELLESMCPEYLKQSKRELDYRDDHGHVSIRLPDGYLLNALPEITIANTGREDVRDELKKIVSTFAIGEEVLDAIILAFNDLTSARLDHGIQEEISSTSAVSTKKATVVIWLHHLLNTNKRKQCLAPPSSVSGVTKPGYPGVLIYSGPFDAVHEHVNELKGLNWAAFQVRLEIEEEWQFKHGEGVVEVEAMKDIVLEVDEQHKEMFLESMRMK